jgi:hypothetical protein
MRLRKTRHVLRRAASLLVTVTLATGIVVGSLGCAPQASPAVPVSSRPVRIDAAPVPLNPHDPSAVAIGDFLYAGGLALTSRETDQLHGLSDLEITGTDRLTIVGDMGILLDARLVFDGSERLVGVADARLTPLTGEDGRPLFDKEDADAEGLALLPTGDRLVSFERRHRIWLYPAGGGSPRPAPAPAVSFPSNAGMEALAADPETGADAYVVAAEDSGDTWACRLSAACTRGPSVEKPGEFGVVGIKRLPGMQTIYLLRAYDVARGSRISLQLFRSTSMVARMEMVAPMTVDNFEGLAAVPRADGGVRFYLLSDDNGSASQRTLLLAFDWRPR